MAEHLERRPKQSKMFTQSNLNPPTNLQREDDLMGQTGRKKGRPPKGSGRMNPASLNVSHQSISSSESSSKTVAAILKQQKDARLPEDATVMRHQLPTQLQGKKSSHKGKSQVVSAKASDKLHYAKNVGSPVGAVGGSPGMVLSPAMSPSSSQGVSPSGKEHGHPVTTKSSSLSRDLSPSRITAQIVKVMADTTSNATPNLLLSALQGNMPDPMGILSTSKTEGGLITVISTTHVTPINNIVTVSGKSSVSVNPISDSLSSLQPQRNTFSSILTSMAGANSGYLGQPADLEEQDSTPDNIVLLNQSQSTVDLLTAPSGSMQTVNVSHTPKSTIPQGFNSGGSSPSAASSPRSSARSAMEVAQQIKMEANGQSANAQRAALRPGMQQQLRSQIKSSRSIDAQLASRQNQGPFSQVQGNPTHHRQPNKETEQQKTLEASMPLLASKLSSSSETAHITSTSIGQTQHHRQPILPIDSSLHKSSLAPSSTMPPSSSSLTASLSSSSATSLTRRTGSSPFSHLKSGVEPWQQRSMPHTQLQKQLQKPGLNFNPHAMPPAIEPHPISVDPSWLIDDPMPQSIMGQQLPKKTPVSLNDLLSTVDSDNSSHSVPKFVHVSMGNVVEQPVQIDVPLHVEGQAQTTGCKNLVTKHLRAVSQSAGMQGAIVSQLSQASSLGKGKQLSQSIQPVGIGGLSQNFISQGTKQVGVQGYTENKKRKLCPGETKQTAIDVDVDFGNLSSLSRESQMRAKNVSSLTMSNCASEDPNMSFQQTFSNSNNNGGFMVSDATVVRDITGTSSLANLGSSSSAIDLQSFLPIQSHINVTTTSSTISSFLSKNNNIPMVTSTLAQIPRPIMHVYSSPSSLASTTAAAPLPPPPDYNPPPPYPSKIQQQQQQLQNNLQQQSQESRAGSNPKDSIPNPFTFPTTGVKVQASHDPLGHLTYSISPHSMEKTTVSFCHFKEAQPSLDFSDQRISSGRVEKSQTDALSFIKSQREHLGRRLGTDVTSRSWSETAVKTEVKLEADTTLHNHVGYSVKDEQDHATAEKKQLVQPFNQRVANLSYFPVSNSAYRAAYRSHTVAVQRARSGVITNTAKSLDVLRQNLQRSINKEITEIIKKYRDKYFQPALSNIRENSNEGLLGNEHINHVCRQILEEAKSEFSSVSSRRSVTPTVDITDNTSETGSINGRRTNNARRGRISDSDSEKGSEVGSIRRPIKRKGRVPHGSGRLTPSKPLKAAEPIRREGPKWDPERIKPSTLFVMGARANKALGLGNTRGRLYIRHPDVFKYVGDQEDKVWLYERSLMPPTGGKAYLLLLEDIEDLSRSDEYKDSPGLMMHECVGFHVPDWMMVKMKEQMRAQRSDSMKRSRSHSPVMGNEDSRPRTLPFSSFAEVNAKDEIQASPADTEDMEFLSAVDNDDTRPSSAISPFVTAGFEETSSISPLELDAMDEQTSVQSIFA